MLYYENTEKEVKTGDKIKVKTIGDGIIDTEIMFGEHEVTTNAYEYNTVYGFYCGSDSGGSGLGFHSLDGKNYVKATFVSRKEEEPFNYNFASNLIEMKIRDVDSVEKYFNGFCNDFHTLSNYHHDFSTEEMVGIMKFLEPLIAFDDSIDGFNEKFNVNIKLQYRRMLDFLKHLKDKETLELILNSKEQQLIHYENILTNNIEKYEKEKKERDTI